MANDEPYRESPATDGEILPVCDFDDRVTGTATRREIHEQNLIHRAVHVVLIGRKGGIVLQKRGMAKDRYPGWWDVSVGGHVGVGESYVEAARREIGEEMGISGADPQLVGIHAPADWNGWEHIHVFFARIDRDPIPAADEIDEWRAVDPADFLARANPDSTDPEWRVTPSCLESVALWRRVGSPGLIPPRPPSPSPEA